MIGRMRRYLAEELRICADELARVRPIYDAVPGWRDSTVDARRAEDLPNRALDYLRFIADEVGVPISLVGVGPRRDQIVPLSLNPETIAVGIGA